MISHPAYPLSPSQSGIWYAQKLDPDSPAYNCLQYLDIRGDIDVHVLVEAVRQVVVEADGLHVRFDSRADRPCQIPLPPTAPRIPLHDLSHEPDPLAAAQQWMQTDVRVPFDLEAGHVCDFAVLLVAPGRTIWVQRYHHAVGDGYTFTLMAHRVAEVYRALRAHRPVPGTPFQPLGAALEEVARYRASAQFADDRAYWHKRYADRPEPLDLTEGSGTALAAHEVRRRAFSLSADRYRTLRAAARGAGTNFSRLLIATMAAYAHRMSGREDVVVGLASRSRQTPTSENFPGMMSDVLPLRLRVGASTTWAELLSDTHVAVAEAVTHHRYRSEDLRQDLGWPERRRFAGPLVNLVPPLGEIDFGSASAAMHNLSIMPTEDLSLCCYLHPGGDLRLTLDVHPDRCDEERLTDHHERLTTLLNELEPDFLRAPVVNSTFLGPVERERLLESWNEAPLPLPDASLGELFRKQAAATPDAVAVAGDGTELSYRELDVRSDLFAGLLRSRGVGPGGAVLVFMERSVQLLVTLLGIVKSGAAYVPLDERQPASRLRTLISQAGGDLMIVDGATRDLPVVRAQVGSGLTVLDGAALDQVSAGGAAEPYEAATVSADAPVCVMFTSGSSGIPCGVQVTHRNVVALAQDRCWRGEAHRRVLWHSPHAFDAVLYELWIPLLSGGRVCVAPPGPLSAAVLREMHARHGVTAAWLTAGLFAALADEEPDSLRGLREVWTGGDAVSAAAVARVFDACPGIVVVNGYGPTETTTFATRHRMTVAPRGPVPIGRAMDNTTLYVLDPDGRTVPGGAPGELWIGGAGVAAGYVNRPAVRERFRDNPFHPGRVYRTGDFVRLSPDGTLAFLGRADDQVKIRGFRVESQDVEAGLEQHQDVARAVVVPQDVAGDGKRLVAYLVPTAGELVDLPDDSAGVSDRQRVDEWQSVYEDMYRDSGRAKLGEDFGGWMDSYSGSPIPRLHMREWRDRSVDRVLALRPRRVLEIGVGSGLLLARLAPHCEEYWATDFSVSALWGLGERVREDERLADRVRLLRREARDLSGIPLNHFDCVVINSVAQYLPSGAYLSAVLHSALDVLVAGGHLYVGDVRPRRLLREFRTGVELRRAGADGDPAELKRAVERSLLHEKELLVEPEFFTEHLGAHPQVAGVDVRVKRGRHHNELTQFRYEAVLRKAAAGTQAAAETHSCAYAPIQRWGHDVDSLPELGRYLREERPPVLRVAGVPNARVLPLLQAEREVCAGTDLSMALDALDGGHGYAAASGLPDPEDFAALGQGLGLRTVLTWSDTAADGNLDVLFLDPRPCPVGARKARRTSPPTSIPHVGAGAPRRRHTPTSRSARSTARN